MELFKVTQIKERSELTPEGTFERITEVHFRTRSGIESYVEIKSYEFSEKKAYELVRKKALEYERVLALEE